MAGTCTLGTPVATGQHPLALRSMHFPVMGKGYLNNPIYAADRDRSLDELAQTYANDVIVENSVFMTNRSSSDVMALANQSESLSDLRNLICQIKSRGMNVSIKASIKFTTPGDWTGVMEPANLAQWFASYKTMMLQYAALAQETGAQTLYIGNELGLSVRGPGTREPWVDIIQSTRAVFKGKVAINATPYDNGSYGIPVLPFADQLDFVGISFYMPSYTTLQQPSRAELVAAWSRNADGINLVEYLHKISQTFNKPVAITEIGYRSALGFNTRAADGDYPSVPDMDAQSNLYGALLDVWTTQPRDWFMGVSFWGWFEEYRPKQSTRPTDLWYAEQGMSIQGKPAFEVLRSGYKPR